MNFMSKFKAQQNCLVAIQISINNPSFDTDQYSAPALWWHVNKLPLTPLQIPATITTLLADMM